MKLLNSQKLNDLQKDPKTVRNICILAHVDHGKTTLADSLVATNGIISPKLAGKLRYMDSRKDEQERGITMKSSSIALLHNKDEKDYLINLIDSPGHVDFASEVSTAVRLCDGAIVIVDVVEGVCPQTKAALKQAWLENIRPVLVLNKMDRLILEMKFTPLDAYIHLTQILEQVNAVMGELFTSEILGRAVTVEPQSPTADEKTDKSLYDWSTGIEDEDDSHLYFSPDQGNVIFASAIDGWGFCLNDFAKLYAEKLGVNENVLQKTLWGDFYLHSKTKRVMKGAQEKAKKPLFVQFVLENLWSVYDTVVVRKEKEKLQKIADSLNIKMTTRDLRHTDGKVQLQALCGQWLPLAKTVLDMVCSKLPSPCEITEEKAEKLMCSKTERFDSLPMETQQLKSAFVACSSKEESPVIVFISKMFPVEHKNLPQNRPQPMTAEEIQQRREQARVRHAQRLAETQNPAFTGAEGDVTPLKENMLQAPGTSEKEETEAATDVAFIAFARVFSGSIRKGQELYVLGPKHETHSALKKLKCGEVIDPSLTLKDLKHGQHITKVKIDQLFLLMGRELEALDEVPAGNVLGIGGLEEHVLKSATLSSTVACPAFTEIAQSVVPIVRVAVESAHPQDMPALVKGLRLLNQADACVQVMVQETGEHVLVTAGEVHLQRCLDDLRERYAKIGINASEPIVPFRETVVVPPVTDMVNENIQEQVTTKKDVDAETTEGLIVLNTPNKQSIIKIRAAPLPTEVTTLLENNADLLKAADKHFNSKVGHQSKDRVLEESEVPDEDQTVLTEQTLEAIASLREKLRDAFAGGGDEWKGAEENIWSLGPRRCGPNILLNKVPSYNRPSLWKTYKGTDPRLEYDSSFSNGFQLASLAGPLCEEPMMGVCFVVEDWILYDKAQMEQISSGDGSSSSQPYGPFSGQIMSMVKESCRRAFQAQPQRLMAAMYSCNIQVNAEVLGKVYAVLGRRHGRILHGDMQEGSSSFTVTAVLPVVESFEFAPEIRKQTSGLASPQLVFSHWEVIEVDPFWVPRTEEEYLHYGEKADTENRARRYMDAVRRRKGLAVQEKLVEFAEKQRTLSKKK